MENQDIIGDQLVAAHQARGLKENKAQFFTNLQASVNIHVTLSGFTRATLCALLILLGVLPAVVTADGRFQLSVGGEYTTGEFGGTESIDEWYVPLTGKYQTGRYVLRLTVPYIRLTAPSEASIVSGGSSNEVIPADSGSRTTEEGLGDIIAGLTYQDLFNTELSSDLAVDFTGKIKFSSADEDKGLGTGENDYTLQADVFRFFDHFTPFATLGYKFRGDPPGVDLDDVWFGVLGGLYQFSNKLDGGVDFYHREASFPGGENQQEMTAHVGYRLTDHHRLRTYVLHGLSDGSPDWGGGVMVTFSQ